MENPSRLQLLTRLNGELALFSVIETVMSGVKVNWKPYVLFIPSNIEAVE